MREKKSGIIKNKGKAVESVEQTVGRTVQRLRKAKGLTQGAACGPAGCQQRGGGANGETGGALPDVALLMPAGAGAGLHREQSC